MSVTDNPSRLNRSIQHHRIVLDKSGYRKLTFAKFQLPISTLTGENLSLVTVRST
jgi:hypothetical protein